MSLLSAFSKAHECWSTPKHTGNTPPCRESHSCTFIPNLAKLYVFGGFDGNRVLNDLYVLDTQSMTWSQIVHRGLGPLSRAGHTATAVGNTILIFGGANDKKRYNTIQIFDCVAQAWDKPKVTGVHPRERYYHTANLLGHELLVFGGADANIALGDMFILNKSTMEWSVADFTGVAPTPRSGHTATLVGSNLFIIGGAQGQDNTSNMQQLNDMHILDTDGMVWSRPNIKPSNSHVGSPHLPLMFHHGAALAGTKLFLYGGSSGDSQLHDVIMVDTQNYVWCVLVPGNPNSPPPIRRHTFTRVAGVKLFVFGGWDGHRTVDQLHVVDANKFLQPDLEAKRDMGTKKQREAAGSEGPSRSGTQGPLRSGTQGGPSRSSTKGGPSRSMTQGGISSTGLPTRSATKNSSQFNSEMPSRSQSRMSVVSRMSEPIADTPDPHRGLEGVKADLAGKEALLIESNKQLKGEVARLRVQLNLVKKDMESLRQQQFAAQQEGTSPAPPEFATKKDVLEMRSRLMQARRSMEAQYTDKINQANDDLRSLKLEIANIRNTVDS